MRRRRSTHIQVTKVCKYDLETRISAEDLRKDTDINDGHDEVRDDAYTVSFAFFGLCGRPVESVQDVLTKGGEETVRHLPEEWKEIRSWELCWKSLCYLVVIQMNMSSLFGSILTGFDTFIPHLCSCINVLAFFVFGQFRLIWKLLPGARFIL